MASTRRSDRNETRPARRDHHPYACEKDTYGGPCPKPGHEPDEEVERATDRQMHIRIRRPVSYERLTRGREDGTNTGVRREDEDDHKGAQKEDND